MLVEVENAHAATYYAAWALDADAPDAALAASVAKSYVGEASRKVCGIGDPGPRRHRLHLGVRPAPVLQAAKHLEPLYGDAEHHRELVLREIMTPVAVPALA